ncbi:cobalamin biosynthesis protein CobG [Streptomyces sp. P38-E01]|uniref:Cobalamin biosynthesis protein CobG n=1 Tax=Streptomyces tardus TaxID=2780544 RepID=A0A949JDF3_9ACTN|nr:cobalamin biosynthesis protein CobG [Streptomyces tardus]MBU7598022.1 cobalamin biosynthesis protein CobG [Streptomyces tardus]
MSADQPGRDSARAQQQPARERDDACPGVLRLHTAADGELARVRVVGGRLDAGQAEVLAMVAEAMGDGCLDLTSRGNVQLRGLGLSAGRELGRWLESCGLMPSRRHERVRNVVASPFAGLDGAGSGSLDEALVEFDELLCNSEEAVSLSGRFLIALDDGRGDVAGLDPDVCLLPGVGAEQASGGALLSFGGTATVRLRRADGPRAALGAVEMFVAAARAPQPTATSAAAPAAPADAGSSAAGGSGARRPWRVRELPPQLTPNSGGLSAALAQLGIASTPVPPFGAPVAPHFVPPPAGFVEHPDGGRSLHVLAPLGRLSVAQWRLLARSAAAASSGGRLRVTPWRGVVLPGVEDPRVAEELKEAGLVTGPDSPWHGVTACTGRPGCASSLADVRADAAAALAAHVPAPDPDVPASALVSARLPVHWSGCARRCGHPAGSWVDVLAEEPGGYRIAVRGTDDPPSVAVRAAAADELAIHLTGARSPAPAPAAVGAPAAPHDHAAPEAAPESTPAQQSVRTSGTK